ncbi:hypothetical protein RJ640_001782 [Escallonia rubra]|uniref:FAR1 domain-containing protein n=1 Tax=Escallonia rubra TaxID=112253 RepID=A0AA88QZA7_9ASTE|nr:hypothetical protein RJ640_001782 [Escallonia rubra]
MGDDVQMIDASSQPCFQPVIDCEPFDIADESEVGVENHEEGDLGLNPYSNGSDKMHIIDNGEMQGGQECGDLSQELFGGQDDAYEFYNLYALVKGFGTRIPYSHKNRMTNEIFRRQFVCNKQGFKKLEDKRQLRKQLKRHRDTRTGCGVMKQITLTKKLGVGVMDKFEDIHNHPLSATPSKVVKHRSHSKYHRFVECKRLIYS